MHWLVLLPPHSEMVQRSIAGLVVGAMCGIFAHSLPVSVGFLRLFQRHRV